MKNIIILSIIFCTATINAQNCNSNTHSNNIHDSWISCTKSISPNPVRGISHWIMYDLGFSYTLNSSHCWNYNVNNTNRGMRDIVIDYSMDGVNWTQLATYTLAKASGTNSYSGVSGPNFGGVNARYVLITGNTNWGGACYGLSEFRIDVDPASCPQMLAHPTLPTIENGIADHESTTIVSSATISNTAKVDYDAESSVTLTNGFCVQIGAEFMAFIDGCNNGGGGLNLEGDKEKNTKDE